MKTISIFVFGLSLAALLNAQIIHIPGDYATIQEGIDAAGTGDTVLVADGTYLENINFLGKAITVAAIIYGTVIQITSIIQLLMEAKPLTLIVPRWLLWYQVKIQVQ